MTKKTIDFCTFGPGDFDQHSQPPPGGPGASIESDISIKMPEGETQGTRELVFNSNATLTNPHLNMSGILGPRPLQEHRIQSDTSGYGFLPTPAGHATAAVSSNRPALQNQFGDYHQYLLQGTGDHLPFQAPMPGPDPLPVPLPGPRSEAWTKAQEDHLMESRKKGCTYPEIRYITFGVDRNPNVLSKRCRMILERNAKDNVIAKFLNGALPNLLQCLEDEVNKVNPELVDEELLQQVHEELRRRFPGFVRSLAL